MRSLLLSLLLIPLAFSASGQVFSSKPRPIAHRPLTLTWSEQVYVARYVDSLQQALVLTRQEAAQSRLAAASYRAAGDSLQREVAHLQNQALYLHDTIGDDAILLASANGKVDKYRKRARRKGAVNVVLSAALGGLLYLLIAK